MSKKKQKKHKTFYLVICPAKFVELTDTKVIMDVKIDKNTIERMEYDKILVAGIKTPHYLAIGLMSGIGFAQITCCNADEFSEDYDKLFQ